MRLGKTELQELQDYINKLDELVGLEPETMEDITDAIDIQLDLLRQRDIEISYFDDFGEHEH